MKTVVSDVSENLQQLEDAPPSSQAAYSTTDHPTSSEDGNQTRDFMHVKDIAKANLNALEHNNPNYKAINVGTGKPISIKELAGTLTELYNKPNLQPYISDEYRKGDIRHC